MPTREWWIFVLSGAALAILAVISQVLDYRSSQRHNQQHSEEHLGIAAGTNAIYHSLMSLSADNPISSSVLVAELRSKLADLLWLPLTPEQKRDLRERLSALEQASIEIMYIGSEDCAQLARDFEQVFRDVGWQVQGPYSFEAKLKFSLGFTIPGIAVNGHKANNLLVHEMRDIINHVLNMQVKSQLELEMPHPTKLFMTIGSKPYARRLVAS